MCIKLIVAGGRDFNDRDVLLEILNDNIGDLYGEDVELVCGMARGADLLAKSLFDSSNKPVHKFYADWQDMKAPCVTKYNNSGAYNALAGIKRNTEMGDYADVLIAVWDGKSKGTKHMIDYMENSNKPLSIYNYNGEKL